MIFNGSKILGSKYLIFNQLVVWELFNTKDTSSTLYFFKSKKVEVLFYIENKIK